MELLINGLSGRVVTDEPKPTFAVRLDNTERFDRIDVIVLAADGSRLWADGIDATGPLYLRYDGPPLEPKAAYAVKAEGHVAGRQVAECLTSFETGFLQGAWDARWIEPEQEPAVREKEVEFGELFTPHEDHFGGQARLRPCREVRKEFACSGRPRKARLYATAHGVYEVSVNGQKVGRNLLAPETST